MTTEKSIEEQYKKLNEVEHVLIRPGRYIGAITPHTSLEWLYSTETKKMFQTEITYNPGFLKLFDEVISNSVDHSKRPEGKGLTTIKVDIDQVTGKISIFDNGGIPVVMHREQNEYIPEMIFGLRAGSNFNDEDESMLTGQNGEGAALTNIFSKTFSVQTCDSKNEFEIVFSDNSQVKSTPKVKTSSKAGYTKITYEPDFDKLKMGSMGDGNYLMLVKRVADVAGLNPHLKVYLNGELIKCQNFRQYVNMYLDEDVSASFSDTEHWKVAVCAARDGFEHISFVNGTNTKVGGTHVQYVGSQIWDKLRAHIKKKHKVDVRPSELKQHLMLFIDCSVVNPRYSSQTKEDLMTEVKDYKTSWSVPEKMINEIIKSEIIQSVLDWAAAKEQAELAAELRKANKNIGGVNPRRIEKFSDATENVERGKCILLLSEGDSASKAIQGARGKNPYIGSFPMRGKIQNVRDRDVQRVLGLDKKDAKKADTMNEIQRILAIIGLKVGKQVKSLDELRFGKMAATCDADIDGQHITGLVVNLFHKFWPELFDMGFVNYLRTPVILVQMKGKTELEFFSEDEFQKWENTHGQTIKGWSKNYYKGLSKWKTERFAKFLDNIGDYLFRIDIDDDTDVDAITLAFSKERADDRKVWLETTAEDFNKYVEKLVSEFVEEEELQEKAKALGSKKSKDFNTDPKNRIRVKNFINTAMKGFSLHDNVRSIPHIKDGLKESQRKAIYGIQTRGESAGFLSVERLAAYIASVTDYHHGTTSMEGTISKMGATKYPGSNNMNLFVPEGQYGSRLTPDAGAARYIETKFSSHFRQLFKKEDDAILEYNYTDGEKIEPVNYLPILPMPLLNGTTGTGTGYASNIMMYEPDEIRDACLLVLNGKKLKPHSLMPWFRGFNGTIEKNTLTGQIITKGVYEIVNSTTIRITELPVGVFLDNYKATLNKMEEEGLIKNYDDYSGEESFDFVIKVTRETLANKTDEDILKYFKLIGRDTETYTLWDTTNKLKVYKNVEEIITEFVEWRTGMYEVRRQKQISDVTESITWANERIRFIKFYLTNTSQFRNLKKAELVTLLESNNFVEYNNLLNMPIWSLTKDRIEALEREVGELTIELERLSKLTAKAMYASELKKFKYDETVI